MRIDKHPITGRFLGYGQHLEAWLPWMLARVPDHLRWSACCRALIAFTATERVSIYGIIARCMAEDPTGISETWIQGRERDAGKLARVKEILTRAFAEIEEVLHG